MLARGALAAARPLAVGVWLVRSWRPGPARALGGAALVALVPAVVGGWFYLRNVDLYGSVTGSGYLQAKFARVPAESTVRLLVDPVFVLGAWQDLWGSFRSNVGVGSGTSWPATRRPTSGAGCSSAVRLVLAAAWSVSSRRWLHRFLRLGGRVR